MNKKFDDENIKEERINYLIQLRKLKFNQKIMKSRLSKKNQYDSIKNTNLISDEKIQNENGNNINEDDYIIDPDDLTISEEVLKLDFVDDEEAVKNMNFLLKNSNINNILHGLLLFRKFVVIDAITINKTDIFIENKLYINICSLLFDYCSSNKKLVYECLWILIMLTYNSSDTDLNLFLLSEKCINLYKKIILSNKNNNADYSIFTIEITKLLNNLLIYKEEKNIIDSQNQYLISFVSELVNLITYNNNNTNREYREHYVSFFIQITNSFSFEVLLEYQILNKIIISLVNDILLTKNKIENYQKKNLSQLEYLLTHPFKEMSYDYFKKLVDFILNSQKNNNIYFIGYINCFISYVNILNYSLNYVDTKKIFDFLISKIKQIKKVYSNKNLIIECIEGINNIALKMLLNKMIGLLIVELPEFLKFINDKKENDLCLEKGIILEILNLFQNLLDCGIKFHKELSETIIKDVINCIKMFYGYELKNDVIKIIERCYKIIARITEKNIISSNKDFVWNAKNFENYQYFLEKEGLRDLTIAIYNNEKTNINIPEFVFVCLKINK